MVVVVVEEAASDSGRTTAHKQKHCHPAGGAHVSGPPGAGNKLLAIVLAQVEWDALAGARSKLTEKPSQPASQPASGLAGERQFRAIRQFPASPTIGVNRRPQLIMATDLAVLWLCNRTTITTTVSPSERQPYQLAVAKPPPARVQFRDPIDRRPRPTSKRVAVELISSSAPAALGARLSAGQLAAGSARAHHF